MSLKTFTNHYLRGLSNAEALRAIAISTTPKSITVDTKSPGYQEFLRSIQVKPVAASQPITPARQATLSNLVNRHMKLCGSCSHKVSLLPENSYVRCDARLCCGGQPAAIPFGIVEACPKNVWQNAKTPVREFFNRVVVISLKRRTDRLERLKRELGAVDWPFVDPILFEAVDGNKVPVPATWGSGGGAWGCMQSHRWVLERAIIDDVDSLLILEDDVTFVPHFKNRVSQFLCEVPEDWDGLMIGGQHFGPLSEVSQHVVKCTNTQRTHCYAVRGRYIAALYQHLISSSGHCDHRMGEIQSQFNVYAPSIFLAGQSSGASDINGAHNPIQFWSPPVPISSYVTFIKCPREILRQVLARGFHIGYNRDEEDLDRGIKEIVAADAPLETKAHQLSGWIRLIQREAAQANGIRPGIWFPGLDDKIVQKAAGDTLITIEGDNADKLLQQWEKAADAKDFFT
jgi:hypothetical protein